MKTHRRGPREASGPGPWESGFAANAVVFLLFLTGPSLAGTVPLTVKDHSGEGQPNAFVCSGLPFARGELKDLDLSLLDADGKPVPAFIRPMARWSDGSIKWLQIQTQLSLGKGEEKRLRLMGGTPSSPERPWKKSEDQGIFNVSTGILSAQFFISGTEFVKSLAVEGKAVFRSDGKPQMLLELADRGPANTDEENWLRDADPGAKPDTCHGVIENFHVDEETPFRLVLRYEGGIVNGAGDRKCSFVLRFYFYRQSARLKVEWTLVWEYDTNKEFLSMCALRLPAEIEGGSLRFRRGANTFEKIERGATWSLVATKPDVRVHQIRREELKPVATEVRSPRGAVPVPESERAGWLDLRADQFTLALAVERFRERYPKELAVSDREIVFYLWPKSTRQVLDLRRWDVAHVPKGPEGKRWEGPVKGLAPGIATTERLWFDLAPPDSAELLAARTARRLLLEAPPDYYTGSGVWGQVQPFSPETYPEYEGVFQAMLYWILRSRDEFKWYGLLNDGASLMEFNWAAVRGWPQVNNTWMCRGYSGWAMDDGGQSWIALLGFLRTGNDDYLLFAERSLNHAVDVSCIHAETEASIQANNGGRPTIGGSRRHNEQAWADYVSSRGAAAYGKIFFYLLTGEPRYLDVIAEGLYFEWIYWSYENWTMVGSLSLGYELFQELKNSDPYFYVKRIERMNRITLMAERAQKKGWKKCAEACAAYLDVEENGLSEPIKLLRRARELLHKVDPKNLDSIADGVITEGVKYYELAQDPDSAGAKAAREFQLAAANAVVTGAGPGDPYAPLFQGRSIVFAHALKPDKRYVDWVKSRLDAMFPLAALDPVSLSSGMKDGAAKLDYMDLWKRIERYDAITPQKIGHIYGMVLGRLPYFLYVLDHAETGAQKIAYKLPEPVIGGEPCVISDIELSPAYGRTSGQLFYRPKGSQEFKSVPLAVAERGRYTAQVPAGVTKAPFEYYIEIQEAGKQPVTEPKGGAAAPREAVPDLEPPTMVPGLAVASAKSYAVVVKWTAATDDKGIAGYRVLRGDADGFAPAPRNTLVELGADALQYADDTPPAGRAAWYAVQAKDLAGRWGKPRYLQVAVPKDEPPVNSLQVKAAPGPRAVTLTWEGEVEPDVVGYEVHCGTGADGPFHLVKVVEGRDAKGYSHTGLDPDKEYRYVVKLRDRGGLVSQPTKPVGARPRTYVRRINCGGPALPSKDGIPWEEDLKPVSGTAVWTSKETVDQAGDLLPMYQTERWSYNLIRYEFDVAPGKYEVVLHFAETNRAFFGAGKRVFDVFIQGEKAFPGVDVFAAAGLRTAYQLKTVVEVKNERLTIELRKAPTGPAIKGIEVIEQTK